MADIKHSRDQGRRRDAKHSGKSLLAPTLGVHTTDVGESRLNVKQQYSLDAMYCTHPAVQAARTVLHSQLLSGGLKLVRDGEVLTEVKYGEKGEDGFNKKGITSHFNQHLEEHWLPFAKDVVDCFIKWGVCPVVFDLLEEHPSVEAISRLKSENGISLGKRQRPKAAPPKLVPHVPLLGTYEIAWKPRGKYGYAREYIVYNNAPGQATRLDEEALVFVRQHPDSVGNCNSPLATVYEQGSFVQAMTELAFNAEITRSQPQIVTQLRKPERGSQLDAGALFFDNESRTLNNEQDGQESGQAARSLEMQAQLCKVINSLQTRGQGGPSAGGGGGGIGGSDGRAPFAPPDIPPKLFTLPKDHELAPNLQVPQPRADLEALIRLGIDSFCSALGVPAALVFEGKFSNNSTTQLQLLNSTVAQLAKAVNHVLTRVYTLLYTEENGEGGVEPPQLKLQTSPLASSEEVEKLFSAGIVDLRTALPAALHALGATSDEVETAMERGMQKEEKRCACEDEDRALQKQERALGLKKAEADLKKTEHDAKVSAQI